MKSAISLDIGSVRMTERFSEDQPAGRGRSWPGRKAYVDELLDGVRAWTSRSIGTWIGVAGTATTLAGVYLQLAAVRPRAGARLDDSARGPSPTCWHRLSSLTVAADPGAAVDASRRADVITGGSVDRRTDRRADRRSPS